MVLDPQGIVFKPSVCVEMIVVVVDGSFTIVTVIVVLAVKMVLEAVLALRIRGLTVRHSEL
jgi:hypothetical protein